MTKKNKPMDQDGTLTLVSSSRKDRHHSFL